MMAMAAVNSVNAVTTPSDMSNMPGVTIGSSADSPQPDGRQAHGQAIGADLAICDGHHRGSVPAAVLWPSARRGGIAARATLARPGRDTMGLRMSDTVLIDPLLDEMLRLSARPSSSPCGCC